MKHLCISPLYFCIIIPEKTVLNFYFKTKLLRLGY